MPLYALVLSVIGFLPLSLLALQLSDLAGARIIQEFLGGQSGVYALDCRRPISGDNPHQLFADYPFAGQPAGMIVGTRRSLSDAGSLTGYVSQVEIHKDSGRLGYFVQTMDDRYSFVWQKEGE